MFQTKIGHQETYTVKTYDIDAFKQMTAPALSRVLNEVAMQHVLKLKLSVWDLEPHQIGWVLLRLELHINRLPLLGEQIHIQTYPSGFERVFTYRDYRVLDEHGKDIATASTTWVLLNTETRRPTRIPAWISERAPEEPEQAYCLPRPQAQLKEWTAASGKQNCIVGWYDLDFNWHLSNTHYLRLLLDSMPADFLQTHQPKIIRVHYKSEANLNDSLSSESAKLDGYLFQHQLLRGPTALAIAETVWNKKTIA